MALSKLKESNEWWKQKKKKLINSSIEQVLKYYWISVFGLSFYEGWHNVVGQVGPCPSLVHCSLPTHCTQYLNWCMIEIEAFIYMTENSALFYISDTLYTLPLIFPGSYINQ